MGAGQTEEPHNQHRGRKMWSAWPWAKHLDSPQYVFPSPCLLGFGWQLVHPRLKETPARPLRQRMRKSCLPTKKANPWIKICHIFLSSFLVCLCREALHVNYPLVYGCQWASSTSKTWRSNQGDVNLGPPSLASPDTHLCQEISSHHLC